MMRMWWYLQLTMGLVSVYETEFVFRSLMAWGKKLFLSLSVFAIMLLKRLPDGSKQKRIAQESLFLKWSRHRGKDKIATHQHDKNLLASENWALKCSWMREEKLCRWHPGLISDPHVRLWPAQILMHASVCLKIAYRGCPGWTHHATFLERGSSLSHTHTHTHTHTQ